MQKMNAGMEMVIILGAVVAQAMTLSRTHYITPERAVMGSEVTDD